MAASIAIPLGIFHTAWEFCEGEPDRNARKNLGMKTCYGCTVLIQRAYSAGENTEAHKTRYLVSSNVGTTGKIVLTLTGIQTRK